MCFVIVVIRFESTRTNVFELGSAKLCHDRAAVDALPGPKYSFFLFFFPFVLLSNLFLNSFRHCSITTKIE